MATDHHGVNETNQIVNRTTGDADGPDPTVPFVYDQVGNLVFDSQYHYRYDAWNRLVAISQAGTLHVDSQGQLSGSPGERVLRFEYDALGRRVLTVEGPAEAPAKTTRHLYGGGAETLAEYDVADAGTSGVVETLERWFVHGGGPGSGGFPDPLVMIDLTDAGDEPASPPGGPDDEYLWYLKDVLGSAGALADGSGQVVERYTYDPYGQVTILDGQARDGHGDDAFDQAAADDLDGAGDVGTNATANLDTDGSADCDSDSPGDVDTAIPGDLDGQLDGGAAEEESGAGSETAGTSRSQASASAYGNPFLWTGQRLDPTTGLVCFHARVYSPVLGRFLQRDPIGLLDATGEPLFGPAGAGPDIDAPAVAAASEYLNSFHLYVYVSSSPLNGTDPFGRDEYDELMNDLTGHKVAALGYMQESAAAVGLGLNMALDIAGSRCWAWTCSSRWW